MIFLNGNVGRGYNSNMNYSGSSSMKKRKKRKGNGFLIFIIVVLVVALVGAVGYIVTNKLYSKELINNGESKNVESNSNDRELKDYERDSLIESIERDYNYYLSRYYPISDVQELSNQVILNFASNKLGMQFSESALTDAINRYFYNITSYTFEDIKCFCGSSLVTYNKESKMFLVDSNHPGHGGGGFGYVDTKLFYLSSRIVNNRDVELKAHILYSNVCGDTCIANTSYYRTYQDAANKSNPMVGNPNGMTSITVSDEDYQKIKNNLMVVVYKFVLEDGNYRLKSVNFE